MKLVVKKMTVGRKTFAVFADPVNLVVQDNS